MVQGAFSKPEIHIDMGGSPGLLVMGGDSCSKGRELESQHHILEGHFSHIFVVNIGTFD